MNEHLRRVHCGSGIEDDKLSPAKVKVSQSPELSNISIPTQQDVSDSAIRRKRKRVSPEEVPDDDDDYPPRSPPPAPVPSVLMQTVSELRNEVMRLRHEVSVRDTVIEQLKRNLH